MIHGERIRHDLIRRRVRDNEPPSVIIDKDYEEWKLKRFQKRLRRMKRDFLEKRNRI